MERTSLIALGMLLACCRCAFGLNPSLDIDQYAHTAWTVREGFFKGVIHSVAQTSDGYLWLGTEFGLLRFDGVRALPWQPPPREHLPSGDIRDLLAAPDGTLWIGTDEGLASWKDGKLTQYPELAGREIYKLFGDREATIWVGAHGIPTGRLCAIQNSSTRCYGEDGSFGNVVRAMYEDRRGNLWAAAQTGLWRWKPGPPKLYPMPELVNALIEDDNGRLLMTTPGGVRQFVDGKAETYPFPAVEQHFYGYRMLRDRDGGLWIGTKSRGVLHVHHGRTDVFEQSDGLSADNISALFEDREGNLWVGTANGLDRFRDFTVVTLSAKQGLCDASHIGSVLAATDSSIWLGNLYGLNRWKQGQITVYRRKWPSNDGEVVVNGGSVREATDSGLPDDRVGSFLQDHRGRIWVSTLRGVAYFENGRFIPLSGVPGGFIHSMAEDSAGDVWIARDQDLIHLHSGSAVEQIPWANLGKNDFGFALLPDPVQRGLWLGFFHGGVTFFKDGQVRASYSAASGLGNGRVNGFRLDRDGAVWVATVGGLSRIKNGRIATLTSKNGLPCDNVDSVMEDDARSFWLNMACGLVRISRTEMQAWDADPKRAVQLAVFDSSDGVRSHAFYGGFSPRVAKSADGKLWFALYDSGVSVIDPRNLPFNQLAPPVHIEQIVADRKTYWQNSAAASSHVRLPPRVRDLEIDYTAVSLVAPEKTRFRYKLEGEDRDWQDVGNRRQAFYNDLPPRNYRFRVTACNNSGVWNEAGAALDFEIAPAYYQTTWFRALLTAAFLTLLWAAYQLRLRQVRREERKLREVIETMPTFAWTALPDGSVDFVNRRWHDYTGLSVQKAAGSGWESAVHASDLQRYAEKWRASIATGEAFESEVRFRRAADGQYRWFLTRAVALRDARGKILKWFGISTEIEDRKLAEQERETLRADLAHVNRVEMLGELAASLSHELKQPITAAMTNARTALRWLKRERPDVEEACEAANRIVNAGTRSVQIIDRLRSLYQKSPPKRELVDVNEAAGEIVVLLRSEANRYAVSVRTDFAVGLPTITADRVQLQQVLMNLMLNAIEAMKETGGVLTVESQLGPNGQVLISVSDTGVGLPAEKADEIFNAFFTTKPQGSGMGLAISRSIIESHGGRLWATANDGRGATFHFSLPTAPELATEHANANTERSN